MNPNLMEVLFGQLVGKTCPVYLATLVGSVVLGVYIHIPWDTGQPVYHHLLM